MDINETAAKAIEEAKTDSERDVYRFLAENGIDFEVIRHEALYTVEDVERIGVWPDGVQVKNLFVRDTKRDRYYLVLLTFDERLDVKGYRDAVGWTRRIAFCGDDLLKEYMGVTSGACSLFCMLEGKKHDVTLVVSEPISTAGPDEKIMFHPNDNRATVVMKVADMRKVVEAIGCKVVYVTSGEGSGAPAGGTE